MFTPSRLKRHGDDSRARAVGRQARRDRREAPAVAPPDRPVTTGVLSGAISPPVLLPISVAGRALASVTRGVAAMTLVLTYEVGLQPTRTSVAHPPKRAGASCAVTAPAPAAGPSAPTAAAAAGPAAGHPDDIAMSPAPAAARPSLCGGRSPTPTPPKPGRTERPFPGVGRRLTTMAPLTELMVALLGSVPGLRDRALGPPGGAGSQRTYACTRGSRLQAKSPASPLPGHTSKPPLNGATR